VRVAFVAAELAPHAQVGGLGDVARWLPASLAALGDDVRVFVPHYDVLDSAGLPITPVAEMDDVPIGSLGSVTVSQLGGSGPGRATVYLIGAEQWFDRGAVYATEPDEHLRFAALSRAVVEVCDRLEWIPHLVHANDWHTALLPLHLKAAGDRWAQTPVVLTIHNLAHQGWFPREDLARMDLGSVAPPPAAAENDRVNSLATGIRTASVVTTVSPTYAKEITEPHFGFGLDGDLRSRGDQLVGILNGIGPDWDPESDRLIPHPYSSPLGKAPNTEALRVRMGLAPEAGVPVLGIVSRLDRQKGFELIRSSIPPILDGRRAQLAVLGTGDPALRAMFVGLSRQFPGWAAYEHRFDPELAHLIEAGSDMFLMPSEFEPCGLNQMYSMNYGTVPVVHRVGGLADTVIQWDPNSGTGTGFAFDDFSDVGFLAAVESALDAFENRTNWVRLMSNGMKSDFSWGGRAAEYRLVYSGALNSAA
jgi:starch synthase